VAYAALFLALGGTAFAVTKIDGSQIARHSVPGNRLKANTVTGQEVKESSLAALAGKGTAFSRVEDLEAGTHDYSFIKLAGLGKLQVYCNSGAKTSSWGYDAGGHARTEVLVSSDPYDNPDWNFSAGDFNGGFGGGTAFSNNGAPGPGGTATIQVSTYSHAPKKIATITLSAFNGGTSQVDTFPDKCRFQALVVIQPFEGA
jgi:hypothetical protein